jgi:hypothetical protein
MSTTALLYGFPKMKLIMHQTEKIERAIGLRETHRVVRCVIQRGFSNPNVTLFRHAAAAAVAAFVQGLKERSPSISVGHRSSP